MFKLSSTPNDIGDPKPFRELWWRAALLAVCGALLTLVAVWVGRSAQLDRTAKLDLVGTAVTGTAEAMGADAYRLRYTHPTTGVIYSSVVRGTPPEKMQAAEKKPVRLVYDPKDPAVFQTRGRAYLPGALCVVLVFGAILCVSYARRMFLKNIPRHKPSPRADKPA